MEIELCLNLHCTGFLAHSFQIEFPMDKRVVKGSESLCIPIPPPINSVRCFLHPMLLCLVHDTMFAFVNALSLVSQNSYLVDHGTPSKVIFKFRAFGPLV
jgi:hypothetical protein